MKKLWMIILLICLTALQMHAKKIDKLINKFKDEAGVSILHVGSNQIPSDAANVFRYATIRSVTILNAEECPPEVAKRLNKAIRSIKPKGKYQTFVKLNKENEYIHIIDRKENLNVTELIILDIEDDELSIVRVKGYNLMATDLPTLTLLNFVHLFAQYL